jgi:hypothetical protein
MANESHGFDANYGDRDFARFLRRSFARSMGAWRRRIVPVTHPRRSTAGFLAQPFCLDGRTLIETINLIGGLLLHRMALPLSGFWRLKRRRGQPRIDVGGGF